MVVSVQEALVNFTPIHLRYIYKEDSWLLIYSCFLIRWLWNTTPQQKKKKKDYYFGLSYKLARLQIRLAIFPISVSSSVSSYLVIIRIILLYFENYDHMSFLILNINLVYTLPFHFSICVNGKFPTFKENESQKHNDT